MNSAIRCLRVISTRTGDRRCRNRVSAGWVHCWRHGTFVSRSDRATERKRTLESMSDCNLCCSWIDRLGYSYHLNDDVTGLGSHGGVAQDILGDHSRGRRLDDEGYVHVSYGDPFMGDGRMLPTQAQLDRLFDIAQELRKRGQRTMARAGYIDRFIKTYAERMAT